LAIALACCLIGGAAIWVVLLSERAPAGDSADAGFARDMATHHAQAVEMAFLVRDASTDESLRALAYDIIVTQTAQRGMFMGWLQQWGLPQSAAGPRMTWMGASGHVHADMASMNGGGLMPGMASDSEMDSLRAATGKAAEVLFLQLMIRHHEGGLLMARALMSQSRREEVVGMARNIDNGQAGEIRLMTEMLAARGAQPYMSILQASPSPSN
jgi:uncharacterized protein (DUF305 family)